jgi:hypothetical protein
VLVAISVSAPLATIVACPVPILQAAAGSPLDGGAVLMHTPPSIEAFDSSPAGSTSVRSLTESVVGLLGANLMSVPSATDEPAWVPAL